MRIRVRVADLSPRVSLVRPFLAAARVGVGVVPLFRPAFCTACVILGPQKQGRRASRLTLLLGGLSRLTRDNHVDDENDEL